MGKISTKSSLKNKTMSTKLIMGVMVAAVSVLVGTAGVVNAMPGNGSDQGYGGNVGGDINIGIGDIVGDNNVINIVINYFVGGK